MKSSRALSTCFADQIQLLEWCRGDCGRYSGRTRGNNVRLEHPARVRRRPFEASNSGSNP
jgi:hypothetical protein